MTIPKADKEWPQIPNMNVTNNVPLLLFNSLTQPSLQGLG